LSLTECVLLVSRDTVPSFRSALLLWLGQTQPSPRPRPPSLAQTADFATGGATTVGRMPGSGPAAAVLLDIDGVLHVGDQPIEGAIEALGKLREQSSGVRLVTNTTSKSRRQIVEQLQGLGFEVSVSDVLTPAALAVRHCRDRGYRSVRLLVGEGLREDLADLAEAPSGAAVDAIVLGDLGDGFTAEVLNGAFRLLMDGAELVALQHNRYWRRADGLALDVGAYSAALEYASGVGAAVVGKPAHEFFTAALADLQSRAENTLMVGDDVEADVGGALAAGLRAVLVRTGKYRAHALEASGVTPTEIVDSIAEVPALLR
jgi:HAD superfamily hydrolase (TIGR01458 family)